MAHKQTHVFVALPTSIINNIANLAALLSHKNKISTKKFITKELYTLRGYHLRGEIPIKRTAAHSERSAINFYAANWPYFGIH